MVFKFFNIFIYMGKFLTTREFIKKAEEVHKNRYDYSMVNYVDSKTKIKIICFEHGVFEQRPNDHLQGKGCAKCGGTCKSSKNDFLNQSKKHHGEKYDYSLVDYKNNRTKVKIICPKHGEFEQVPYDHSIGLGCAKCGNVKALNTQEFILRAKGKHNNYDYSLVEYKNMHTKVKIICPKHGVFEQTPHNHLKLAGCPKCKKSKGEKIISWFLDKNEIQYEEQKKFDGCKNKTHLPFDFYLSEYNICIEFQGIQHFKPVEHMNGNNGLLKRQKNDNIKREFCKKNGIGLLEINYSEKIVPILKVKLDIK